jgi:hypothetical protein
MESDRAREDREHGRRWRRKPFTPATFHRPLGGGRSGSPDREPRDPGSRGGGEATGPADAEHPPSSG